MAERITKERLKEIADGTALLDGGDGYGLAVPDEVVAMARQLLAYRESGALAAMKAEVCSAQCPETCCGGIRAAIARLEAIGE